MIMNKTPRITEPEKKPPVFAWALCAHWMPWYMRAEEGRPALFWVPAPTLSKVFATANVWPVATFWRDLSISSQPRQCCRVENAKLFQHFLVTRVWLVKSRTKVAMTRTCEWNWFIVCCAYYTVPKGLFLVEQFNTPSTGLQFNSVA